MQIYYINLDRRTDRRSEMEARLEALGLEATRVSAVTPDLLTPEELDFSCNPENFYCISPVELCCSLSHLKAIQAFLQTTDRHAVILEDDAVLSPRLPAFLSAFERSDPDIDVVRLETYLDGQRFDRASDLTLAGIGLNRSWSWASGAAAYIIDRKAALIVINSILARRHVIDRSLFNPYEPIGRQLRVRHCMPGVAVQLDRLHPELRKSDLDVGRKALGAAHKPNRPKHLWWTMRRTFWTEIVVGTQRMGRTWLFGAKKVIVPFASE